MLNEVLREGKSKVGEHHYKKALIQKKIGGTSMSKAIDLIIFLSSDVSSGLKGKIINAIWDDWINLINKIQKIQSSDVFTLKEYIQVIEDINGEEQIKNLSLTLYLVLIDIIKNNIMIKNKKIFKICYENFMNCSSNYYSDTWKVTSYQNTFFKKKLELDEFFTNNNIRGLAPLDNYPSTSYLNSRNHYY